MASFPACSRPGSGVNAGKRVVTGELSRILMIVCLLKKSVHNIACIVISIIIFKSI